MNAMLMILVLAAGVSWTQATVAACCKCEPSPRDNSGDAICLTTKEMRGRVDHIEPLKPSGLDKGLNLSGTVAIEVRFGPDGKVACARALEGHPIAIAAAMDAIRKWTFKPIELSGVPKAGCGRIKIKYKLRDRGSSTAIQ